MTATEVLAIVAAIVFVVGLLVPDARLVSVGGLLVALAVLVPHLH